MRRHPKLIPLSRFHRSVLFLALLAKKNGPDLKGYPKDWPGKRAYALQFYQEQLQAHFELEEAQLFPLAEAQNETLARLAQELRAERKQLRQYFEQLAQANAKRETLHELGVLLEKHIRKEERQFFQAIQAAFDEELWQKINFEDA